MQVFITAHGEVSNKKCMIIDGNEKMQFFFNQSGCVNLRIDFVDQILALEW